MRSVAVYLVLFLAAGCDRVEPDLTVFAAASATDALTEIARAYEARAGKEVRLNLGSSGMLARQIHAGAPADVYLSASGEWVDYLEEHEAVISPSRCVPMRNRLVMVCPSTMRPASGEEVEELWRLAPLAMGDPGHVPAGRYAKEALVALGVYGQLEREGQLHLAQNVRAALLLVELSECYLGAVYATDAHHSDGVRILFTFPDDTHAPIDYVAVATGRRPAESEAFLNFLCGAEAASILEHHGFEPVSSAGP